LKKQGADEHTLCGHTDASPRGIPEWNWGPSYPGGAVQGKVIDGEMAKRMTFAARRGHPCGENFLAAPFLKAHTEYSWQQPVLRDMIAGPWTVFHSDQR